MHLMMQQRLHINGNSYTATLTTLAPNDWTGRNDVAYPASHIISRQVAHSSESSLNYSTAIFNDTTRDATVGKMTGYAGYSCHATQTGGPRY
jgi:hypothetical protein